MEPGDYDFAERLLHHLALGSRLVGRASFELDALVGGGAPAHGRKDEAPVFVSGLARAGTTVLMRAFHRTGRFRSLTYRDMPFVLMPRMWARLSSPFRKHEPARERAHGDGILVDFDSPEAFEEVFWRTFAGDDYILEDCLRSHAADDDVIEQFREYVQRVVDSSGEGGPRRYLSKNNNNILRLGTIRKAFPDSLIAISFRDPLQHAVSLLSQHRNFCERQSSDRFSYHYMRWLGHHEFGVAHKPFRFGKDSLLARIGANPGGIDYWLAIWIEAYGYLLASVPPGCAFVCYEDLCEAPLETLEYLFGCAGIPADEACRGGNFAAPPARQAGKVDPQLESRAREIHRELRARAIRPALRGTPTRLPLPGRDPP